MAFQTLNINGRIRMNSRVMNENGREGWTMETYIDKNQEKGNHYNYSRSSKNFELTKGGNFAFLNDNRHIPIEQRLNARLAELNFHYYKEDSKNAPYSCVDIIVGGDHDRMCELAKNYGNITSWARDNYNFFADKFGEDNIISFCVHMDETTPHAHVLIVPTALRKQRGRVKSGEQRKAKEVISFKAHFGDLSKANSRKAAYQKWHDEYYQAVGKKWGFERGRDLDSMTAEERAEHTHLHKTELDKRNELRAENKYLQERKKKLNDEVQAQEKKVADSKQKLQDLENTVADKKEELQNIDTSVANKKKRFEDLDTKIIKKRMEFATLTSDIATKQAEKDSLDNSISAKRQEIDELQRKIEMLKKTSVKNIDYRADLNKVLQDWFKIFTPKAIESLANDAKNTGLKHITPYTARLVELAIPRLDEDWRVEQIDLLFDEAKKAISPSPSNWVELFRGDCEDVLRNGALQYCQHVGYTNGRGI